jgi:hypothetical protein
MKNNLLELPTIDFLKEITRQSLNFYEDGAFEFEKDKAAIEFVADENYLCLLLDKFEHAKSELSGDKVLTAYIEFRCQQIKRMISNEDMKNSAYNKHPEYGVQYYSLISDILSSKSSYPQKIRDAS